MAEKQLSEVEHVKEKSDFLRGTLVQGLENRVTGALFPDDTHLIKFHGAYQQTDRDLDSERKAQKLEPLFSLMIRVRVPGGVAPAAQWRRMDELADRFGNGTLKLTTRQAFQLHGIAKTDLKATIAAFNEVLLDSIAGCGDVNRNVMCSPAPPETRAHAAVQSVAEEISRRFTPKTTAYAEIWLDGKRLDDEPDDEPIYGKTYLPRKFKIALAVPPQNDTDIFSNDIGLVAIEKEGVLEGFNVAAGGGLGMTFGLPETFPRLADLLGFVKTADVFAICEAIITTQRDHGNRENRKLSRLKYTVERLGLANFKAEIERRAGVVFQKERPFSFDSTGDRYGWSAAGNGRSNLTIFVEGGRVDGFLKKSLREIAGFHDGDFRLTGNQNLVVGNVSTENRARVGGILGVETAQHSAMRLNSLACVALNTCSQAFAEAERYLPSLLDKIEAVLQKNGLENEPITIRMTGCPNGCARPYLAEIGLVGKAPGRYNMYLGAAHDGSRLNKLYREMLDEAQILAEIEPILIDFAQNRLAGERFGDFAIRRDFVAATVRGTDFHA